MLNRSLSLLVLGTLGSVSVLPQAVISTHSGVINAAEGSVSIDNQPFEQKPGRFPSLKEGSTLRTSAGRAEVLLTPDVILRLGSNSAVRMVSNSFSDTRVGFLSGSAILESGEAASTPVTILYGDYEVQSRENSVYRFDSESPELTVLKGKAKVSLAGQSLVIGKDHTTALTEGLHAREAGPAARDSLDSWTQERDEALSTDSDAASKTTDDLSVAENWDDGSGLADPYSGVAPAAPGSSLSPFGISPSSPTASIHGAPLSPFGLYSNIYAYPMIEPFLLYPVAYYPVPAILRPSRIVGLNSVLPFAARPAAGIPPVWRPRIPASLTMPIRPTATMPTRPSATMPMRPAATRPVVIGAPHVGVAGHR